MGRQALLRAPQACRRTLRTAQLGTRRSTAAARFKKLGDWSKVSSSLLELYGPSKKATVGRWVRAARGITGEVLQELKNQPDLKGAYVWGNPYLIYIASQARSQLTPAYGVKALAVLKERLDSSESMSAGAFQDAICKPMKCRTRASAPNDHRASGLHATCSWTHRRYP